MSNQPVISVTSRAAMTLLDPTVHTGAYLDEDLRRGVFALRSGTAPNDPQQGIYVPSSTSGYYWERDWDGVNGRPEWFGAIP